MEKVATTGQALPSDRLGSRANLPEFVTIQAGKPVYVAPTPQIPLVGQPGITLSIPVFNPQTNQLAYVLVGDVRCQHMWDLLAQLELDASEEVYILDDANQIIAYKNPWIVLTRKTVNIIADDGQMTGLNGNRVLFGRNDLIYAGNRFVMVSEQAIEKALAVRDEIISVTVIAVALVFFLALILTFGFVLQIVRPIKALSTTANAIAAGNLTLRAQTTGHDEISQLGEAFNTMTGKLNDLINGLEAHIQERTRDLELVAEVSKEAASMMNMEALLPRVAELTRDAFGLYQASIYVYRRVGLSVRDWGIIPAGQRSYLTVGFCGVEAILVNKTLNASPIFALSGARLL